MCGCIATFETIGFCKSVNVVGMVPGDNARPHDVKPVQEVRPFRKSEKIVQIKLLSKFAT